MGNINSIPVISQIKSAVEASYGDMESACRTQVEFSKTCPVVSQFRSLVEVSCGNPDEALKTQMEFSHVMALDSFPVASQIKSAIQASCGDMDASLQAQEKFSRQCMVVSQVRSAVEAIMGDLKAAENTQHTFLEGPGIAQGIFIVGVCAAPAMAAASIAAMGFETGGIGGAVSAGSACVLLQSAGAAGLSTGASLGCSVVGGTVGAAVGSSGSAMVDHIHGDSQEKRKDEDEN
eukprot:gene4787-9541_t